MKLLLMLVNKLFIVLQKELCFQLECLTSCLFYIFGCKLSAILIQEYIRNKAVGQSDLLQLCQTYQCSAYFLKLHGSNSKKIVQDTYRKNILGDLIQFLTTNDKWGLQFTKILFLLSLAISLYFIQEKYYGFKALFQCPVKSLISRKMPIVVKIRCFSAYH